MGKMNRIISLVPLLLLVVSHLAQSRSIREESDVDGVDSQRNASSSSFLEWGLSARTETCEPVYGILPCSSNVWGLLFLIVVYEILLTQGGKFVATGSNIFFQMTGPGIFGASLFQILGTFPSLVMVLSSALTGSVEAAQQRATLGMGLVAGTTVMLLTLIWGTSVILGSYDLSEEITVDKSENKPNTPKGYGVVTDAETSYTARIMAITMIPFVIILLAKAFTTLSGRRVVYLIALIVTFCLLFAYMFYQVFQPWIQNRRFEYLMNKYAKDKILRLLSRNGKPDTRKIEELFGRLDKNNSASVSAAELRVLLLGVRMDDDDLSTERDVENILASFDVSGDGRIDQAEFVRGMTQLVSDLSDQTPNRIKKISAQNSEQLQQGLLAKSRRISPSTIIRAANSWLNYAKAFFFVIFGTVMLCLLSEPLIKSVVGFAQAANLSSFIVAYLAIPYAMNYGVAIQSIASSRTKTHKSISLTLSSLYNGVYMNNIISLIVFLAPVYARNLAADVFAEVVVVLVVCIGMTLLTSFRTTFPRWLGYVVLSLYPVSLVVVYVITSVLGWA